MHYYNTYLCNEKNSKEFQQQLNLVDVNPLLILPDIFLLTDFSTFNEMGYFISAPSETRINFFTSIYAFQFFKTLNKK